MPWILLLLALFCLPAAAEMRDPMRHFFQLNLGDLREDLATARAEGKTGILLMYEMDGCPFCERMKNTVLSQSAVQDYYRRHFIVYAMDTRGDARMIDFKGNRTTEKDFAQAQRARATPTFVFHDLDGREIARYTGATQTATEFLLLGSYVVSGAYRTSTFTAYRQEYLGQ